MFMGWGDKLKRLPFAWPKIRLISFFTDHFILRDTLPPYEQVRQKITLAR